MYGLAIHLTFTLLGLLLVTIQRFEVSATSWIVLGYAAFVLAAPGLYRYFYWRALRVNEYSARALSAFGLSISLLAFLLRGIPPLSLRPEELNGALVMAGTFSLVLQAFMLTLRSVIVTHID